MTEPMTFDDRVAIVTGGGGGLGREYAKFLTARGAAVVINDVGADIHGSSTSEEPGRDVVQEINASGGVAALSTASVTNPLGAISTVELALAQFGRIDIVVHSAGLLDHGTFLDVDVDQIQRQLAVHITGTFNMTQAAWPWLVDQSYGRIVMTTSSAGLYGAPAQVAYCAAKAGVVGLVRSLAALGANHGIKVNGVSPGAYTRMMEAGIKDEAMKVFSRRARSASKVAPAVGLLCHEKCPSSGDLFAVSGGRVAKILVTETQGFFHPGHSMEDLYLNWNLVEDETDYHVPGDAADSVRIVLNALQAAGEPMPEGLERALRSPGLGSDSPSKPSKG